MYIYFYFSGGYEDMIINNDVLVQESLDKKSEQLDNDSLNEVQAGLSGNGGYVILSAAAIWLFSVGGLASAAASSTNTKGKVGYAIGAVAVFLAPLLIMGATAFISHYSNK